MNGNRFDWNEYSFWTKFLLEFHHWLVDTIWTFSFFEKNKNSDANETKTWNNQLRFAFLSHPWKVRHIFFENAEKTNKIYIITQQHWILKLFTVIMMTSNSFAWNSSQFFSLKNHKSVLQFSPKHSEKQNHCFFRYLCISVARIAVRRYKSSWCNRLGKQFTSVIFRTVFRFHDKQTSVTSKSSNIITIHLPLCSQAMKCLHWNTSNTNEHAMSEGKWTYFCWILPDIRPLKKKSKNSK